MASKKTASKKRAARKALGRKTSARRAPTRAAKAKTTSRSRKGKYVYDFKQGSKDMKELLGGKGANLAEMTNIGLPVPPGFTITTVACREYMEANDFPSG